MKRKQPTCPDWLSIEAKKEWERICIIYDNQGRSHKLDTTLLTAYCQSYARWIEAEKFLNDYGTVYKGKSGDMKLLPQVEIAYKYQQSMKNYYKELRLDEGKKAKNFTPIRMENKE